MTMPRMELTNGRWMGWIVAATLVVAACDSPNGGVQRGSTVSPPVQDEHVAVDQALRPGARLYDKQGELWGTVVATSDAHHFENGVVEAGVLVDYGPRTGDPPVPPQWLPKRSAERFTIK